MIRNAKGELVPVDVSRIPTMSESIKRLPNDLPKQTKTIILDSLTNGKAEIKTLQVKVTKLDAELKTLKEKYPTSPDKWADVSADLQYARSKLSVALSGNVEQMQMQLQATRDNIEYLRGIVNSQADDVIRNEARTLLKQAMADEKTLTANLKQAYNAMDAEWTRQELRSGGGTTTVTRPVTRTPITGFGTGTGTSTTPSTNTMTMAQLAALRGDIPEDAITPSRLANIKSGTSPMVSPVTYPGTSPQIKEITKPKTTTHTGTKQVTVTRTGVKPSTVTSSGIKPAS